MKKTLTLALALILLTGTAAFAGGYKQVIKLKPTTAIGLAGNMEGLALIAINNRTAKRDEVFAVRVFGDVKDGTTYSVAVDCAKGKVELGTVKMLLGSGSIKIHNPVVPVRDMWSVMIDTKRGTILKGEFNHIGTN